MKRQQRARVKRAPRPRPVVDRRRNPESVDDRTLIQWAIEACGLTTVQFAADVMHVSPRSAFRYLSGDGPLNRAQRAHLIGLIRSMSQKAEAS